MSLPEGPLVAWLGDDFTGGAAVAETLAFAGLPAAMFLEPPTPAMLARFPDLRGIGIATTARAESPGWMNGHLPDLYAALVATGAPLVHYKACSTMDSAPQVGSLGRALELGLAATGEACAPILFASPEMGRFQAFGQLFAAGPGGVHRIDRHPVMSRHPVTPMDEADICRHLARQTDRPLAALMRPDLAPAPFERLAAQGAQGVAVDCAGEDDLAAVGRILWSRRFVLGSQGVQSALLAHWRAQGWLPAASPPPRPSRVERIAVVCGSASAVTARQISWAEARGWPVIRLDAAALFGAQAEDALERAIAAALAALGAGRNPVVVALRGPDDPALAATRAAIAAAGLAPAEGEARIGEALGQALAAVVAHGVPRTLVAGGDTSGRVTRALGILALEPTGWIAHGASLQRGHRADGTALEIILKGGQMGPEDLFERALGPRAKAGQQGGRPLPGKPRASTHREDSMTIRTALLGGLGAAALAAGLGTGAQAATICFAFQDLETEFWVAGHKAITTTLTEAGHTVIERNAQEDANRQLEQVNDCIAQGVDGIIVIPQDGESAVTIVETAQENDVPIAVFNRPPSDLSRGIIVVADNAAIASQAVDFIAQEAMEQITDRPIQPLIIVGDLGDPNAVGRRDGFYAALEPHGDRFATPIEVASEWDAATALANLEAAVTATPEIDMIFTSSDFLFPTIRSVLEPRGMWVPRGQEGHVLVAGLDGDATACQLIKDGFVDSTGVQDLYFEAESALNAILAAVEAGEAQPNEVIEDPGFALTADNLGEREMDMWGCVLLSEGFLNQ